MCAKWIGTSTTKSGIQQEQQGIKHQSLDHEAKVFIMELVQSAIDGIVQSSLIPQLNSMQLIISPSSKSAKMLNDIGKYNAIAYLGLTVQDEVSNMLKMLDSNEHEMIKFNTMKAKLMAMQQQYPLIQFTLWMETMREMMKYKFESKPNEKNMLKGFTPCVLQKWMR